MYRPLGFGRGELGDVEVIEHLGELHLFHLTLPGHDRVAHLTSTDGIRWTGLPDALTTGPPGAFDDDMIWTVSVTHHAGEFVMLYTALGTGDEGLVQRVGAARSTDLVTWHKVAGPVSESDPRWYVASPDGQPWVTWRDPKPFLHDGTYYLTLAARQRAVPFVRQGAVALLTSEDLVTWQCLEPLFAPSQHFELECPQVFELGGTFYLTAITQYDRSQRYWIADELLGPYRTPSNNRLVPDGHCAVRVSETRHGLAAFCWHRSPLSAASPADTDAVVPSPLILAQDDGPSLVCRPWPELRRYAAGSPRSAPELASLCSNRSAESGQGVYVVAEGQEVWSDGLKHAHLHLRAEFALRAPVGGVAFALDHETGGLYVEFDAGEKRIRLVDVGRDDRSGRPWFWRRILQEAVLSPAYAQVDLELVFLDGEVVVSVGGRVLLATVTDPRRGSVGVFAISGRLDIDRFEVDAMKSAFG